MVKRSETAIHAQEGATRTALTRASLPGVKGSQVHTVSPTIVMSQDIPDGPTQ